MLFAMGDDFSYGLNTLGPLCLWQCLIILLGWSLNGKIRTLPLLLNQMWEIIWFVNQQPISEFCGLEIERYKLCLLQFSDSRDHLSSIWTDNIIPLPFYATHQKTNDENFRNVEAISRVCWLVETQLRTRHACGNLVRHHIIHLLAAQHIKDDWDDEG